MLLPLYAKAVFSEAVLALAQSRGEPISFDQLQQLEMDISGDHKEARK